MLPSSKKRLPATEREELIAPRSATGIPRKAKSASGESSAPQATQPILKMLKNDPERP